MAGRGPGRAALGVTRQPGEAGAAPQGPSSGEAAAGLALRR